MIRADVVLFDAYGTLLDVHAPVMRLAARFGDRAESFSRLWRQKQLEYTWLRSLMRRHADFAQVTADALDHVMEVHGIRDAGLRAELLALYEKLSPHADALACLKAVAERGLKTAILSNGSPGMLNAAVVSSGLADYLDAVISVEQAGIYKPDPRTYALAFSHFGEHDPRRYLFISANPWDCHGAAAFGFQVVRVNRAGLPDEKLPGVKLAEIPDLSALSPLLG